MAKFTRFDTFSDVLFSFEKFKYSQNEDNTKEYNRILKILREVIKNELTNKQKTCLNMYYKDKLNTIKISKILGVYPSTVWRHIRRSERKIKKIIQYYHRF